MPNQGGLGLGAYQSGVTFHSARLKMVSGSASLDIAAGLRPKTIGLKIVSARWGLPGNWADVTPNVRDNVARGQTIYADFRFLNSDPIQGQRKVLEIEYATSKKKGTVKIAEGGSHGPITTIQTCDQLLFLPPLPCRCGLGGPFLTPDPY